MTTGLKTLPSTKKGEEWECRERNVTTGLKTLPRSQKGYEGHYRAEDTTKHSEWIGRGLQPKEAE